MKFHPLSELFPLLEGEQFNELVQSIKENGQREPITVLDGQIIDGRNRYRACIAACVEPRFVEFENCDPHSFVIDMNLRRRHLNDSQRSIIAARLATFKFGENQYRKEGVPIETPSVTMPEAAKLLSVSRSNVSRAKQILKRGTPEEIAAIEAGEATVHHIETQIKKGVPKESRTKKPVSKPKTMPPQARARGHETLRNQAKIWNDLRVALEILSGFPKASDVVKIASAQRNKTDVLKRKLPIAAKWMEDFNHEWTRANG